MRLYKCNGYAFAVWFHVFFCVVIDGHTQHYMHILMHIPIHTITKPTHHLAVILLTYAYARWAQRVHTLLIKFGQGQAIAYGVTLDACAKDGCADANCLRRAN